MCEGIYLCSTSGMVRNLYGVVLGVVTPCIWIVNINCYLYGISLVTNGAIFSQYKRVTN